jgi:hypothetical protein
MLTGENYHVKLKMNKLNKSTKRSFRLNVSGRTTVRGSSLGCTDTFFEV